MGLRLVCKSFDQAIVPHLFNRIYTSDNRTDLEIAELVVQRFGPHIRTIKFSSTHYDDPTSQTFQDGMRRSREAQRKYRSIKCLAQHEEHAWNVYIERRAEWRELHESGEFVARLCFFLGKIPRLRTIMITRFGHGRIQPQNDPEPSNSPPKFVCPDSKCKLSEQFSEMTTVPGLETKGSKLWHTLMLALSVNKTFVEEIRSDHQRSDHRLPYCAFDTSQRQAVHLQESFRYLKKLELTLTEYVYDYGNLRTGRSSYASGNVAKIFSGAHDLEQLEICTGEIDDSPAYEEFGTRFRAFFNGCTFPKLQSLILARIESTEDELIDFLTASPGIEKLELNSYDLTWGLWEDLVQRIKALLHLKTVSIPRLFGGLPEPFCYVDYWIDEKIVENFFLHDGENPFMKEVLEKIQADSRYTVG